MAISVRTHKPWLALFTLKYHNAKTVAYSTHAHA